MKTLLANGVLKIGLYEQKIEQIAREPSRCNNCKAFGHKTITCNNKAIGSICGGDDDHDMKKCTNVNKCGEKHSSYYKGCSVYKANHTLTTLENRGLIIRVN